MPDIVPRPENLPVPVADSFGFVLGSKPLRNSKHEAYCRFRALLKGKIEAYREAGFDSADDHAARGNANKLERRKDIIARIAWLTRDEENILREKRREIEGFLWAVHNSDIGDLWETVEVEKTDKKGNVLRDGKGEPIMVKRQHMRMLSDLSPEVRRTIESISVDEKGRLVAKTYSKIAANAELRKFLNMGQSSREDGDIGRLSDAELIAQLAQQAKDLGIEIDLSYRLGGS
jgi:hypothetical protein